jgi:carboxylesterase type B
MASASMPSPALRDAAVVQLSSGAVSGIASEDGTRRYLGIPYATPPVGARRWRPPAPPEPWAGIRPAVAFGADCPQQTQAQSRAARQSEDCLYLNVWAPPVGEEKRPVMVWLHGGSFVHGSGSDRRCDGEAFARAGIVLVTVNYRVGLFGFLAHPALIRDSAEGSAGNYGLLDQLAALRWVRENIAGFGGDRDRVTVFGVSAGSASISLLLVSPLAAGLFQRAILHSPGAFRPLASLEHAAEAGRALGDDLAALRLLPAEALRAKTGLLTPKMRGLTTPRVLRPIRDGWVIPEDERPAFLGGRFHAMPVIVGSNADEGTNLVATWPIRTIPEYKALIAENFGDWAEEALEQYPVREEADARRQLAMLFADTQFNYGVASLARVMARARPTWRYLFLRRRPGRPDGPHHGEEVAYVFGTLDAAFATQTPPFDGTDRMISRAMLSAWARFAESGNPNGNGLAAWPGSETGGDAYLEFGDTIRAGQGWRARQLAFLDRFFARSP